MACGVHLGIFLIFLAQAEHGCCSWASQAQRQNGNTYVGLSQQDRRYGGSYLQNGLRQASLFPASAQSSGLNSRAAVNSGSSQGLSSSGYARTVSLPVKSGHASVRLAKDSSVSKPQKTMLNQVNVQKLPKKQTFSLSSPIASGSSVSKYNQNQSRKTKTLPIQQGPPRTSKYLSSSAASLKSLQSRDSYSFKPAPHQLEAEVPAAGKPVNHGQGSNSPPKKSSSLFTSAGSPESYRSPVRTKTSASGPARRVSKHRTSAASKPSSFSSLQNERARSKPSQYESGKPHQSQLFPVSNIASTHVSHSQFHPVSNKHSASAGFHPRSQKLSSKAGTSDERFSPTRTFNIPQRFGGFAIRRLKEPVDQKEVGVKKSQQTYVAPQRQAAQQTYVAPQRQAAQQTYVAPQRQAAQQTYVAPQRQAAQQTYVAPQHQAAQQTYVAPQRQAAQQTYVAPQRQAAQQTYVAPQRQAAQQTYVAPKQQVPSVHPESKWKRVKPNLIQ